MPPSTFRNKLLQLENIGNVDIKSDNKKSVITVVHWGDYQVRDAGKDSTMDNNRTTTGQQQDTDKNIRREEDTTAFDRLTAFDTIWVDYPRRLGKKAAYRHFMATVKNEVDYARIKQALANYKAKLVRDRTEERFIQHGSTWFNNWEDWENVSPLQTVRPRVTSPLLMSESEARRESHA